MDLNFPGRFLLVEGGGSHTLVLIAENGTILHEEKIDSMNRVGQLGTMERSIVERLANICSSYEPEHTYFALGAAATDRYMMSIAAVLRQQWSDAGLPWGNVILTNDIVPLFFAREEHANQLVVIAGTGSGIAGRAAFDRVVRAGANEYLLGDEGGAFDIGCRALRAVLKDQGGRGRPTLLTERSREWARGEELNWFVYESASPKRTVASFCPHVFAAARQGDAVAEAVLDQAAADLADVCHSALDRLSVSHIEVTFTGSLLCETTGSYRDRLAGRLVESAITMSFDQCTMSGDLLEKAARCLFEDGAKLHAIAAAIPAVRI